MVLFLGVFICLETTMHASSKSYDDIFKQVFGRMPEKQYFSQQMALIVDYQYIGEDINVMVPSVGSDFKLFSYTLLKYLYDVQKPGTVRELTASIDKDGMVSLDSLIESGYDVSIDRRAFTVNVLIPARYRQKIIYYINGSPEDTLNSTPTNLVSPANVSAFLNYSFSTNYIDSKLDDSENGLEAPIGSFYGSGRHKQYLLNYSGSFDLSTDDIVTMGNLNVQKDWGEDNRVLTVGQISPINKGQQSSLSLMGVSYTSGPILDSIGSFSPQFSHEIEIDANSQIDIYINYKHVKTLNLPGGLYELKGFPLRTGFNIIKIVKTSYYDVEPPTLDDYVVAADYNDISDGVLYATDRKNDETLLDQTLRLHQKRQESSDWLLSNKIPRKGIELSEDIPILTKKVETEYVYPFSVDPVLYDPKYLEFNYGMGYPVSWSGFTPTTTDQLTQSFYVKKGLNKLITTAAYTQFNRNDTLLGNEVYISSPFGPIIFDAAIKQTDGIDSWGVYSRLGFLTYPIYSHPDSWFRLMNTGFSVSVKSSEFIGLGLSRPVPNENSILQYSMGISYQLFNRFSGSTQISTFEALTGDDEGDQNQFSTAIQYSLPKGFRLSFTYQNNHGEKVVEPEMATFKLSWSGFGGGSSSALYKETIGTQDVQIDAMVQQSFFENTLNTSASYLKSADKELFSSSVRSGGHNGSYSYSNYDNQLDHQVGYILTNQRFNTNAGFLFRDIDGALVNQYSFSAESAFVYADNHFAVSSPIQDSFAIFAKDSTLDSQSVFVGDEGRQIGWFGPTVIPSLSDRVVTDVMVDIPSLPIGSKYDRIHSFKPVNIQGYLVEMRVTPSVLLMGKLIDSKKKPKKYFRGYIHNIDDPSNKIRFITSRSGIFQAANLVPGDYVLTFGKKPYELISIIIPKDANGLYRLSDQPIKKLDDITPYKDVSELESQLQSDLKLDDLPQESESDLLMLLNDLIETILAESVSEFVSEPITENSIVQEEITESIKPLTVTSLYDEDLSTLEQSERLHQLRTEIKDIIVQSNQSLSLKDSLFIAQKINEYYIESYDVATPNTNTNDSSLSVRSTFDKSLIEHRKMKQKKPISSNRIQFNIDADVLNEFQTPSDSEE